MTNDRQPMNVAASAAHTNPKKKPARQPTPVKEQPRESPRKYYPPDSIPNPMPGLDPQQTPGIDRFPENED